MEFPFNINNLFGNEICLIEKDLTPYRTSPLNIREYKAQLCQVIDKMGEASAKAQGLHGAITTAHRLQLTDHRLYVMKDPSANGGKGAVIGFIKIGHKRLFIYDRNGVHHEMEPLCTLDFYVHESRQRMGCGRKLFEFMLKSEHVQPHQLAIDRPSHKFLAFLNKHYKLKTTVPQVNNFVVFESFFRDKSASSTMDRKLSPSLKPPSHPYRRLNSREFPVDGVLSRLSDVPSRPPSGSVLPRAREKEALSNVPLQRQNSLENGRNLDRHQNPLNVQAGSAAQFAMGAHNAMYSRHGSTPPTPTQGRHGSTPPTPTQGRHGNTPPTPSHGDIHGEFRSNGINNTNNVTLDVSKRIIGGKDPPLRRRDGPSEDYQRLFTTDSYQDRRGHLKVAPRATTESESHKYKRANYQKSNSSEMVVTTNNNSLAPSSDKSLTSQTLGSGWNIFGVPPNPRTGSYNKLQQTKLW